MKKELKVTAYTVEGDIDYDKLVKQFGAQKMDEKIKKSMKRVPFLMRRNYVYAHRDFDKIIKKPFAIVSGRGVSNNMHLGHLTTLRFVKELQDIYGCYVFIPFSDDEKFMYNQNLDFEAVNNYTYENMLDVAALGFDPKKTEFVADFRNMNQDIYNLAMQCAKKITISTVKAAFGFKDDTNIGINFYPAVQAAHILYPSKTKGLPVMVPVGIDQDPFLKLTRDIANKLDLPKPGGVFCAYMPGLKEGGKMSSSDPNSAIYTTDSPSLVETKIKKYAFSGGQGNLKEHREKGGNPDIDVSYQYLTFFLDDDKKLKKIHDNYISGKMLTSELKQITIDVINKFLKEHQKNRELAKKKLDQYMKRK